MIIWSLFGFPPENEESKPDDKVLWEEPEEEDAPPFVFPPVWSPQWERQQRRFLSAARILYQKNLEANRRIMLACIETMKVPYV